MKHIGTMLIALLWYSGAWAQDLILLLPLSLISHGIGVWAGSRNSALIRPDILKKGVAVFSVLLAIFKLITG